MALCRELGPGNVGLSTGDATVNRDAPVLCCTAEVLSNIALRDGANAAVVPLLTLPRSRHGLARPSIRAQGKTAMSWMPESPRMP